MGWLKSRAPHEPGACQQADHHHWGGAGGAGFATALGRRFGRSTMNVTLVDPGRAMVSF